MSTFRAAIFDFDETMIDLERQHATASRALCEAMGSDYDALPAAVRESSGVRIIDEVATIREHFGWNEPLDLLVERRGKLFLAELASTKLALLPGVEAALQELHAAGFLLAVASSGMRDYIESILQRTGVRPLFDVVVAGDEVHSAKPDPEIYLEAAAKLQVAPHECIVFEDSEIGVGAAKNAGMYCIAVRNVKAKQQQNLDRADEIVTSFEEVDISRLSGNRDDESRSR